MRIRTQGIVSLQELDDMRSREGVLVISLSFDRSYTLLGWLQWVVLYCSIIYMILRYDIIIDDIEILFDS
jgi:hypothetical protein